MCITSKITPILHFIVVMLHLRYKHLANLLIYKCGSSGYCVTCICVLCVGVQVLLKAPNVARCCV